MPCILIDEPPEVLNVALAEALDVVDFAIILFNSDMRLRFVNRRFAELWQLPAILQITPPTLRQLLDHGGANEWYDIPAADLPAFLDARERAIRAGSIPPVVIDFADRRRMLFQCVACADGGRILTYTDISLELRREASDAVVRVNAELRFNTEVLEDQASYLVSLAETAAENAQKAEQARILLENEIAERQQLEIKLRVLATTDGLTGALNRREFLACAQRAFESVRRAGQSLVVLMIDVDHFKAINDRFGHAGGDYALQYLVATLRDDIRDIDFLGRLGGEEFAIALTGTQPAAADAVAERLCAQVAGGGLMFGGQLIPMTISIGLAVQQESDGSIEQVMTRADDALYRAKRGGRNQVVKDRQPAAA